MARKIQEQNLRNGISLQWGSPATTVEGKGFREDYREEIYFNFTAYENGEVQVRTREDTVIMGWDALKALMSLACKATGRSFAVSPELSGEFRSGGGKYIQEFLNASLKRGGVLSTVSGLRSADDERREKDMKTLGDIRDTLAEVLTKTPPAK